MKKSALTRDPLAGYAGTLKRCLRCLYCPWMRLIYLAGLTVLGLGPGPGPDMLERVGSWPGYTRGPAYDVAIAGHYALVAIGEGGLVVLDIADPTNLVRVGDYLPAGRTEHVQVVGVARVPGHGSPSRWRLRVKTDARKASHPGCQ